jgi:hypothetical protein
MAFGVRRLGVTRDDTSPNKIACKERFSSSLAGAHTELACPAALHSDRRACGPGPSWRPNAERRTPNAERQTDNGYFTSFKRSA